MNVHVFWDVTVRQGCDVQHGTLLGFFGVVATPFRDVRVDGHAIFVLLGVRTKGKHAASTPVPAIVSQNREDDERETANDATGNHTRTGSASRWGVKVGCGAGRGSGSRRDRHDEGYLDTRGRRH